MRYGMRGRRSVFFGEVAFGIDRGLAAGACRRDRLFVIGIHHITTGENAWDIGK